ncbi:hypothetical protein DRO66_05935 [Candidatus Bathyarchaeota archaeon]|nr:MAG: hypothetical protein DRO66_05935 [Candidatus Bathyarchaeota archaeon]
MSTKSTEGITPKQCPFCEEEPVTRHNVTFCRNASCGLIEIDSVEEWNTRPIEDKLKEVNAELLELLEDILEWDGILEHSKIRIKAAIKNGDHRK